MSDREIVAVRRVMMVIGGIILLIGATFSFVMLYPFKTVVFTVPVEVVTGEKKEVRPGELQHQVPLGGVVNMRVHFTKYINNTGLIIRTLVRKKGSELIVLDSSTVVSSRKAGSGTTDSHFVLTVNRYQLGPDCQIIFSIYYTLYGVRTIVVQYASEPFTIYDPGTLNCLPTGLN